MTDVEPVLKMLREQLESNDLDDAERVALERLITWIGYVKRDQRKANMASRRMFKFARKYRAALKQLYDEKSSEELS